MNLEKHKKKLDELSSEEDSEKGYAGKSKKFLDFMLPRFKTSVYKNGEYVVIDSYTGQKQNIGQAITFYRGRPIYGSNYYGIITNKNIDVEEVFDFLKRALRAGAGKSKHRDQTNFQRVNLFTKTILQKKEDSLRVKKIYCSKKS